MSFWWVGFPSMCLSRSLVRKQQLGCMVANLFRPPQGMKLPLGTDRAGSIGDRKRAEEGEFSSD